MIAGYRRRLLLGVLLCSAMACAASEVVNVPDTQVTEVRLSATNIDLFPGDTTEVDVTALDATGSPMTGLPIAWSTTDEAVVTILPGGLIVAVGVGTATLRATVETVQASADVVVSQHPVASVEVAPTTATLQAGDSAVLSALARDASGDQLSGHTFAWTSADAAVATVEPLSATTARLRAVASGTTSVTASADGVSQAASVTVSDTPPPPPPPVASVEVSPGTATVQVGDSVVLTALARDASGDELSGHTFTWTSANGAVATIEPLSATTARLVAVAAGTTSVTASADGVSQAVSVTVSDVPPPPPPPVASVEVSPGTATVQVGDSVVLTALARDASGDELSGHTFTWTSANGAVATIEPLSTTTARLVAVAAGTTSVTASADGVSQAVPVTVSDPPPPPGLAEECGSPASEWIWCDDFEVDRLGSYYEYNDGGGSFTRTSTVGVEGSTAMRARWTSGQVSAGNLNLAVGRSPDSYRATVTDGTEDFRELYWRVYVRLQDGWVGGGGYKLSRATVFHSPSNWGQAMIAHLWSGDNNPSWNYIQIDPASGTDAAGNVQTSSYNDFDNLRWLGLRPSNTPIFDSAHVGTWYCVEAQVRLNDAGASNGEFRLWIDDTLEAERDDLNWVGNYQDYGLNAVFLENYWNGGSPATQERYLDNFVISTARIGCG